MPAGRPEIAVTGLRDLQRALKSASKDARKEVRAALKDVAEPIRGDAERRAGRDISGLRRSTGRANSWAGMRIGVTQKVVYVAPKQRGRASKQNRNIRRPNLANLLMNRAMQPALDANRYRLERDVEHALDRVADHFNHGGPL